MIGSGTVSAVLREIDRGVAVIEGNILDGRCDTLESYAMQRGVRHGLLQARGAITERLDDEMRDAIGLPPRRRTVPVTAEKGRS